MLRRLGACLAPGREEVHHQGLKKKKKRTPRPGIRFSLFFSARMFALLFVFISCVFVAFLLICLAFCCLLCCVFDIRGRQPPCLEGEKGDMDGPLAPVLGLFWRWLTLSIPLVLAKTL